MTRPVISRDVAGIRLRPQPKWALALGALAALCALAGCGSNGANATPNGAAADDASAGLSHAKREVARYREAIADYPSPGPAVDAAKVSAMRGKTVLFVPIGAGAGPFIQQQASLEAALGRLGMKLVTCDPKFVPSAAAACMDDAETQGAAAVVTSGIPYALASNAYRSLEKRGIPTLASSAGPGNPPNTATVAYLEFVDRATKLGQLQADEVIAQSNGAAKVLYVNGNDSPVLKTIAEATLAEFKTHCPDCVVVDAGISAANMDQLPAMVSSKLISHPDTEYVVVQADPFVPGVLSGVQSSNFAARVKAIGQTGDLSVLQMVQQGRFVVSDIGVSSSYEGWTDADAIVRMLTGVPVEKEPFNPIRIFDAKNLKGVDVSSSTDIDALYGSDGFKQAFSKAWGVG